MNQSLFHSHRLYKIYNKPVLRALVYFCVWLNLCLAFFEEPAVQGMTLPYWVSHLRLMSYLSAAEFKLGKITLQIMLLIRDTHILEVGV